MKKIILLLVLVLNINLIYSQVTISSIVASSTLNANWLLDYAKDNNVNTVWSSGSHTNSKNSESITIFFDTQDINYIKLRPRFVGNKSYGFPVSFKISYNTGTEMAVIHTEYNYPQLENNDFIIIPFDKTINTNSIRVETIDLGSDDNGIYYFQLAEISAGYYSDFNNKFTYLGNNSILGNNQASISACDATSSIWPKENAIDNDDNTIWSSGVQTNSSAVVSFLINFQSQEVNYVKLTPRFLNKVAYGFPTSFKISYYTGSVWKELITLSNFSNPVNGESVIIPLVRTINTDSIRIETISLSPDDYGYYYFQLADMSVGYDSGIQNMQTGVIYPATIAASSSLSDWPVQNAIDNDVSTIWSSNGHSTSANSESVTITFNTSVDINYLQLTPRFYNNSSYGFPTSFNVSYYTGTEWKVLFVESNFPKPDKGDAIIFPFINTVNAKKIKIEATNLGSDGNGNYYFQLVEVSSGLNSNYPIKNSSLGVNSSLGNNPIKISSFSATSSEWPEENAFDNNKNTIWSSGVQQTSTSPVAVTINFSGYKDINFIKLFPRFIGNNCYGFPKSFKISYYTGTEWKILLAEYNFVTPSASEAVTIPFINTINTNSIKIESLALGTDDSDHYYFQLAEISAGYNSDMQNVFTDNVFTDSIYNDNQVVISSITSLSTDLSSKTEYAYDNNKESIWTSTKQIYRTDSVSLVVNFENENNINYIKIIPRILNDTCYGLPTSFKISYYTGIEWKDIYAMYNYKQPNNIGYLFLPLMNTISAKSIKIKSITLGTDNFGYYYFQLAEISAGYDSTIQNEFETISNDSKGSIEIRNVGSNDFDPTKLAVWHDDVRKPFLQSKNIYAPSIVNNGSGWNIYYGGWDTLFNNTGNDNIYMATSNVDFTSIVKKQTILTNGSFLHVNNASVIKVSENNWKMLYTVCPDEVSNNKTYFGSSSDGENWVYNYPITMSSNYSFLDNGNTYSWNTTSDINGGNALFYENGLYHLFFIDWGLPNALNKIQHAISSDCLNFSYIGTANEQMLVPQDVKKFTYNDNTKKYYFLGTHLNATSFNLLQSDSISKFQIKDTIPPFHFTSSSYIRDHRITSLGLIQNDNRLYGLLYGSSYKDACNDNQIYARWLQKKVVFEVDNEAVSFDDESAYGSDRIRLYLNSDIQAYTGKFKIYDCDGATLLYTSPSVTVRAGDVWDFTQNLTLKAARVIVEDSVSNLPSSSIISIYPNPIKQGESVLIHSNSTEIQNKLRVFDMNGNIILNKNFNSAEFRVNTIGLDKGVYLFILNETYVSKVIIK